MKIIIAEHAGFCMGVKRAVDCAIDESRKAEGTIYTIGPLIHNNETLALLHSRGVHEINEETQVPDDASVLIRAHGIPPEEEKQYRSKGFHVIDGTCPKVKTVHKVIRKYHDQGYHIVITGDEGHAEVKGLMGYAKGEATVISHPEDIARIPDTPRICVVSQTTFSHAQFDLLAHTIQQAFPNAQCVIKKTICAATNRRQAEIRDLATRIDALVVVGGKHSANTKRLASLARDAGLRVQHVETEHDIAVAALQDCRSVGITAGASTPNWMIKRVADFVQGLDIPHRKRTARALWHVLDLGAYCNIFMAGSAVCAAYFSCTVQGYHFFSPVMLLGTLVVFLYFFSMHLWNSVASSENTQHLGVARYTFYNRHKTALFVCAGCSMGLLLAVSAAISPSVFFIMLFSTLIGTGYHLPVIPKFLHVIFPYRSIKDVPTSKDLFVALAWGILITVVFQAAHRTFFTIDIYTIAVFALIFLYSYIRSLLLDLRDIEGDRIMGRETLITLIGEHRAIYVINGMQIALVVMCILPATAHLFLRTGALSRMDLLLLCQVPGIVYVKVFIDRKAYRTIRNNSLFNLLCNAQFFIVALLTLCASFFVRLPLH